jgi:hypothetical protein
MTLCWCGRFYFERSVLPTRRLTENFEFIVGSTLFTASVGRVGPRAQVREVFINSSKIDSDVDLTMRDAAVVLSIALQYGITAREMAKSMGRNPDGRASSPVGEILDILKKMESGQ